MLKRTTLNAAQKLHRFRRPCVQPNDVSHLHARINHAIELIDYLSRRVRALEAAGMPAIPVPPDHQNLHID